MFAIAFDRHAKCGFAALPAKVQPAVWEFIHGPLADRPPVVGSRLLDPPLRGLFRAKRGEYAVLHEVDNGDRVVRVQRIEHRRSVYGLPLP